MLLVSLSILVVASWTSAHRTTARSETTGALVVSLAVSVPFVGGAPGIAVVLAGAGASALEKRAFRAQLRGAGLA